jgi:type VI secretion system protein ImpG
MADDLQSRYNRELEELARWSAGFAERHADAARALRLTPTGADDPHVQRLLEGVAFLGSRVRERLDDELPELTDALLGVLYPHYLAPFPSCMIAQLRPRKGLSGAAVVPRDTLVQTEPVPGESTQCRFRTTAPVTLWPVEIEDASLSGGPLPKLPVKLPPKVAGTLRITLRTAETARTFEALGIDRLRLHLAGNRQTALALYELLGAHVVAVAFAASMSDEQPVVCPASAVEPAGFAPDEAMLPRAARGFAGFRLLSEYFAFPDKFLFVDIAGMLGKCRAGARQRMEIVLYLDQIPAQLERSVGPASFALGCVPLINLFEQRCEPIELDWTRTEYRVHPDLGRPKSLEVWSVESVRESRMDGSERPWRPFFRMTHGDADDGKAGGSYLPVRRPCTADMPGNDMFLAIDDPAFRADRTGRQRLSVEALCTNRDLPRRLPAGEGRPVLQLESGAAIADRIVPLSAVSEAQPSPQRDRRFWRLISHLSLSHLSIAGGTEGAAVLREVLRLYNPRGDKATGDAIDALLSVSAAPGTARLPNARLGAFCRGLDVRLTFDAAAWQASGLYLLGSVLERFLALHGSVNGFVRTTAMLQGEADAVARWPARAGTRTLL